MFTGIIEGTANLKKISKNKNNFSYIFSSKLPVKKKILALQSINGVCLTLVKFSKKKRNNDLYFDISPETLKITNLINSKIGDLFNIEKSLKFGDEIAGHFVQGHVDDIGKIKSFYKIKNSW